MASRNSNIVNIKKMCFYVEDRKLPVPLEYNFSRSKQNSLSDQMNRGEEPCTNSLSGDNLCIVSSKKAKSRSLLSVKSTSPSKSRDFPSEKENQDNESKSETSPNQSEKHSSSHNKNIKIIGNVVIQSANKNVNNVQEDPGERLGSDFTKSTKKIGDAGTSSTSNVVNEKLNHFRTDSLESTSESLKIGQTVTTKSAGMNIENIQRDPDLTQPTTSKNVRLNNEVIISTKKSEDSKTNKKLDLTIKDIWKHIQSERNLKSLLTEDDNMKLEEFFEFDDNYICLCYMLFREKHRWPNVFDFSKEIGLESSDNYIYEMYENLQRKKFILNVSECEKIETITLLETFKLKQLRELCTGLKIESSYVKSEAKLIHLLLKYEDQTDKNDFKEQIFKKMGFCIQLNEEFNKILSKIHLLYSFPNKELTHPEDLNNFIISVKKKELVLPHYNIDSQLIFYTKEEFCRYHSVYEEANVLKEACKKNPANLPNIYKSCKCLFEIFETLPDSEKNGSKPEHFRQFSVGYKCIGAITKSIQYILKAFDDPLTWLEQFLKQQYYCGHKRGKWYDLLAQKYHQLGKHKKAAETVIEALKDDHVSTMYKHKMISSAKIIQIMKNTEFLKLRDEFKKETKLMSDFYKCNVTIRTRKFERNNNLGDLGSVVAAHYKNDYSGFCHRGESFLTTIFGILFWDIIYEIELDHSISPFISKIQYIPLDLYFNFYKNRQKIIAERLNNIERNWKEDEFISFVKKIWKNHSIKKSIIDPNVFTGIEQLCQILFCLSRTSLRIILNHLLKDFRNVSKGFPTFIAFDAKRNEKITFIHVKEEKDPISVETDTWLKFLSEANIDVEVFIIPKKTYTPKRINKDDKKVKGVKKAKK